MSTLDPDQPQPDPRTPFVRGAVLAEAIIDPDERARLGLPTDDDEPFRMVLELNLRHREGLDAARTQFMALHKKVVKGRGAKARVPIEVGTTYYAAKLSVNEARSIVQQDANDAGHRALYRVWPDFPVKPLINHSVTTIKGDAAQRSYAATGNRITWAVVDSGIDGTHPHFARHNNLDHGEQLHRDFTKDDPAKGDPLHDGYGHGTHVAGIIAGGLAAGAKVKVAEHVMGDEDTSAAQVMMHDDAVPETLAGVAPACRLLSLKVLDDSGSGHSSNIIRALRYIREELNGEGKMPRVQGVNLSVGYEFDAKWFACGHSPLCVEVDRLVRSGVVVVVAAGNTGYGSLAASARRTNTGLALTINDPGNAANAITVGATHRDMPHTYGVSYFSSKGPTGDGRAKPDLVAPGERITSCAAGRQMGLMFGGNAPEEDIAAYIDDSGTSMAAPHVSGAIAAFLSIRREFIGQPERVKQIFMDSATTLGRVESFQGRGLVDLMRAIQSV